MDGVSMTDTSNGLRISLKVPTAAFKSAGSVELTSVFENVGDRPLALTFWWNRFIKVEDERGKPVNPGPGPVLPCGVGEDIKVLRPGQSYERREVLGCTQPAGLKNKVGWGYDDLPPGRYTISLVFEFPPTHGYAPEDHPSAWKGRVESRPVTVRIG